MLKVILLPMRSTAQLSIVLVLGSILTLITACSPSSPNFLALSKPSEPKALSYTEFVELEKSQGLLPDRLEGLLNPAEDSEEAPCDERCQDLRQEFRYVVYVGQQIYCYWNEKTTETGIDYSNLAHQLEKKIKTTTTSTQYFLILKEWAAAFHDGHVNVMPGADGDISDLEIYSAPLRLEILSPATDHEKVIVSQIKDKDFKDLNVGDEIFMINGLPVREALDQAEKMQSGSTSRMRRFFAARQLVDAMGIEQSHKTLELTLKNSDNTTKTVKVYRNVDINEPKNENPTSPEPAESSGKENISALRILSSGIGYLRIDAFSGSMMKELFHQAMNRLMKTQGLIIDLRKNGGGDLSGDAILARLSKTEIIRYKRSERLSDFILNARPENYFLPRILGQDFAQWHDLKVQPSEPEFYYDKKVVALIGPNCFSACDTFSASLRDNALATFIGEGTGGGTGTPLIIELPHSHWGFRYSVIRGQTPNGYPIEGVGTLPDILVEPTVNDRKENIDNQLAQAIQLITDQKSLSKQDIHFTDHWKQSLEVSPTQNLLRDQWKIRQIDQ